MRKALHFALAMVSGLALAQTTTYTGTITNLIGEVPTSGLVTFTPTALGQIFNHPSNTTLTAGNLANELNATSCKLSPVPSWCSGSDIGAWTNAAIAHLGSSCGTVVWNYGTYTATTQIVVPSCVSLDGHGSTVNVGSLGRPALLASQATAVTSHGGSIRNLTINHTTMESSTTGIWLGGDSTGKVAPSTNTEYLTSFSNVHVTGFQGAEWVIGNNVYQDSFRNIWGNGGGYGISIIGPYYSENLNFYDSQFLNNSALGIYEVEGEVSCTSCSIDYNQGGGVYIDNGVFAMHGGHLEQSSGLLIYQPVSTNWASVNLTNVGLNLTASSITDPAYISMQGRNSNLSMNGVSMNRGHSVTYGVYWKVSNIPTHGVGSSLSIVGTLDTLGAQHQYPRTGTLVNLVTTPGSYLIQDPNGSIFTPTFTTSGINGIDIGQTTPMLGSFTLANAYGHVSRGPIFTPSGCSVSSPVGGATAGSFVTGTNGVCLITVTVGTGAAAPHSWSCWASDQTTFTPLGVLAANPLQIQISTATTTASGDTINFGCIGY